jgi:hypothetical protein
MLGRVLLQPKVPKVQLGIRLESLGMPIRIVDGKVRDGPEDIGKMMLTDHLQPNEDRRLTSTKVRKAEKVTTKGADANAAATEVLVQHFTFSLT